VITLLCIDMGEAQRIESHGNLWTAETAARKWLKDTGRESGLSQRQRIAKVAHGDMENAETFTLQLQEWSDRARDFRDTDTFVQVFAAKK
jgi:hypothetical protein